VSTVFAKRFLWFQVSFLVGVASSVWIQMNDILFWAVWASFCLLVVWFPRKVMLVVVIFLGLVIGNWYFGQIETNRVAVQNIYNGQKVVVEGIIDRYPANKGDKYEYWIKVVTPIEVSGMYILAYDQQQFRRFAYGQSLVLEGKISVPDESESYRNYLTAKNILGTVAFPSKLQLGGNVDQFCGPKCTVISMVYALKDIMIVRMERFFASDTGAFMEGILFGYDENFSKETKESFRKTGISHVLAVSGYNVALIGLLVNAILEKLYISRKKRFLVTMFLVGFFVVLAGAEASVVRAGLLVGLLLSLEVVGVYASVVHVVSLCAFLFVWQSPLILLYDVGFQLSFLAGLGLLTVMKVVDLTGWLDNANSFKNIIALVIQTCVAQIMTLPVILTTFGQVSLVSVLANLVIVPLIPFLMLAGIGALFLSWLPGVRVMFVGVDIVVKFLFAIIEYLSQIPLSFVELETMHISMMVALSGGMVMSVILLRSFMIFKWARTKKS
jgi:competence protein ComEC